MPPKVFKRGGASAAAKKTVRGGKLAAAAKTQLQHGQPLNGDVLSMDKENLCSEGNPHALVSEEDVCLEDKGLVDQLRKKPAVPDATVTSGFSVVQKDDEHKDSMDAYEKAECLDLEDNDPEYEPEEYGGGDEDDKELEQGDSQDLRVEVEEETDEGCDEEGDVLEEEFEDGRDELEMDEHADPGSEHVELVSVAEEEEHHEFVKERRKRKEFEIFVGGLDKDATREDLHNVFSQVGEVMEIRLMMNPQTRKNKGFAFLRFKTVDQAKRAVMELRNPVINGKQCGVTPSEDSDTLFLGNICKTWSKDELKENLKHFGVGHVEDLTLVDDTNNVGMNRGFAFLEFSSRSDAMDAFKRLQKRDVSFGVDRPAKVSFADSFIDPGDEIMAQVKTVFVDGLPASWDEDRVRDLLKRYGVVEKIELARNMPSARRKDFGFVTFDTHDAAVTCAKSINNTDLGDGDNKAKVRARLSRPLQRGKGKHFVRGDYRPGRSSNSLSRGPWVRPTMRTMPSRSPRAISSRFPLSTSLKRPIGLRDRRPPVVSMRSWAAPMPPPPRSYDRRAPPPHYQKGSMKRDYNRHDAPPPRSRTAAVEYSPRAVPDRRPYRDEYAYRSSAISDVPRVTSRAPTRRGYIDDGYDRRYERPPPSYRESRDHDYDSLSGSKRPYSSLDDASRYSDGCSRHMRSRMDYELGPSGSYEAYGERVGRSTIGYGSRSQESHGLYNNRHGMSYGGSYNGNDAGGMYTSGSYGGDYMSRSGDGSGSYPSMYSSRGMGSSNYMGPGSSTSYY